MPVRERSEVEELAQAIGRQGRDVLLLLASFDGVLAGYEGNPEDVRVPARRLGLLRRLQRLPHVVVAVISGRPLDDLRSRLPLRDGAFFVGLHGLETVGPGFASLHADATEPFRERMAAVAERARALVGHVPGVRLELKGPIVALHTREADAADVVWSRFQLLSAAADLVNSGAVRTMRGQDVLELLPNVGDSRAAAVVDVQRCIASRFARPVFTVYVGADWPDDDAINGTGHNHVVVVVGRRSRRGYHLGSPEQLDALLRRIIAQRTPR
jgi:trehalose 6-phosphate phosphatase